MHAIKSNDSKYQQLIIPHSQSVTTEPFKCILKGFVLQKMKGILFLRLQQTSYSKNILSYTLNLPTASPCKHYGLNQGL